MVVQWGRHVRSTWYGRWGRKKGRKAGGEGWHKRIELHGVCSVWGRDMLHVQVKVLGRRAWE